MVHSSIRSFIHSAPAPSGRPPLSARYAFPSGTGALGVRSWGVRAAASHPSSTRPERVDDGPPHATGKDQRLVTHTAACTPARSVTQTYPPIGAEQCQLSSNSRRGAIGGTLTIHTHTHTHTGVHLHGHIPT